jgi:1-acyl-sn-glycerol-3-phosphate acyltransferase
MISFVRTILTIVVAAVMTLILGTTVLVAAALGVKDREGGLYAVAPRLWSRSILWAAGVKFRVHGMENVATSGPFIFTCNHVSLFDIPALVLTLPRHYFVAKSELFKIPVFGPGIRAVGTIPIERTNQKAAFGSYKVAAERIRNGSSVIVFPEGTRGTSYPIRPFKKGPFVLAVEAGVPIVPCLVHGTIEVLPKKTFRIRSGWVDVHLLEPVSTAGYTYDDRNTLAEIVHDRMATAMNTLYLNG